MSDVRSLNAFGATRAQATGSLALSANGFAGQHLEAATGLFDMRARDYDPASGRFTANDPVAVPTGMPYVAGSACERGSCLISCSERSRRWLSRRRQASTELRLATLARYVDPSWPVG